MTGEAVSSNVSTETAADNTVEVDCLRSELEKLKQEHKAALESKDAEIQKLKDKLIEYITIPAEKMPQPQKGGLAMVDDWIDQKEEK